MRSFAQDGQEQTSIEQEKYFYIFVTVGNNANKNVFYHMYWNVMKTQSTTGYMVNGLNDRFKRIFSVMSCPPIIRKTNNKLLYYFSTELTVSKNIYNSFKGTLTG